MDTHKSNMSDVLQTFSADQTFPCHTQSAVLSNDSQGAGGEQSIEEVMLSVPLGSIFFVVSASSIVAVTVLGNILVITAVFAEAKLRKVGNFFIVSLAISDLLVGLFVTPVALVYHLMEEWTFGAVFCDVWIAMDVVCCTASIINLCVISFDRYNAITRPLRYALKRTATRAAFIIAAVWTYAIIIAIPPFIGQGDRANQKTETCTISQDVTYTVFSTVGAYFAPLIVMVITYIKVFRATLKRKRNWVPLDGRQSDSPIQGKTKSEKYNVRKARVLINVADSEDTCEAGIEYQERQKGRRKMSVFASLHLTPGPRAAVTVHVPSSQESLATTPSPDMREARRHAASSHDDNSEREMSRKMLSIVSSPESVGDLSDDSAYDCATRATSRRTPPPSTKYSPSLIQRSPSEKRLIFKKKMASFTSTETITTTTGSEEMAAETENRFRLTAGMGRRTGKHQLQVSAKIAEEGVSIHEGTNIAGQFKTVTSSEHLLQITETAESTSRSKEYSYDERSFAQGLHEKALTIERGRMRERQRRRRRKNRISLNQERRAAKTLGVIMGCFVICWLPFFIIALIKPFCKDCQFNASMMTVFTWMGYLNSALNPIIYTFFNQDFRKGFQRILCCTRRQ